MVTQSLIESFGQLGKNPLVWTPGIVASGIILFGYLLYLQYGIYTLLVIPILMILALPLLMAGTYGIIHNNSRSIRDFGKYAKNGYIRCLLPNIATFLIAYLITQFVTYILIQTGMNALNAVNIAIFIFIPIMFFCYFADITAVINNLSVKDAIKDSAILVSNGSFSMMLFYMINTSLFFMSTMATSTLWVSFAYEDLLPFTQMMQEDLIKMPQEQIITLLTTPNVIYASAITLAIIALIVIPFFTVYKACFFKKLAHTCMKSTIEADGEYDEKGRWFKYT